MAHEFSTVRYKLIMEKPYLTTAALALHPVKSEIVPTMAVTARWRCYYNQEKLDSWSLSECVGVLEHELWHLLRDHFGRFRHVTDAVDARTPEGQDTCHLVNIAEDMEINDDLKGLPKEGQFPTNYGYPNGELAEEYYDRLLKLPKSPQSTMNCGSGAHGVHQPWEGPGDGNNGGTDSDGLSGPGVNPLSADAIRKETAKAIQAAARGTVPAGLELWANKALEGPKLNWKQQFKRAVRKAESCVGQDDYLWSRPSRRSEAFEPFIVPSLREFKPNVAVVIDTSGSMSYANRLSRGMKQIEDMLIDLGKHITIICCDAEAYAPQRVGSIKSLALKGGGGTSMTVGIEAAGKARCDLIVVVTDGETDWPDKRTRLPVIAVIINENDHMYGGGPPNWMKTIKVKDHEIHD